MLANNCSNEDKIQFHFDLIDWDRLSHSLFDSPWTAEIFPRQKNFLTLIKKVFMTEIIKQRNNPHCLSAMVAYKIKFDTIPLQEAIKFDIGFTVVDLQGNTVLLMDFY